ncbi:MAG: hypothetical protein AB1817_11035 [Chloroflexota bacterium]
MDRMTIELPESVTQELDNHRISAQQVRAFVVEAVEAWLRVQEQAKERNESQSQSRFAESAIPFAEKLVRENRTLFERLARL